MESSRITTSRPLVDEQHDEVAFGVVEGDRLRDVLHQHGLTRARRRDDQRALALTDRRDDVDDAGREVFLGRVVQFELEPLRREQRRQVVEVDLVLDLLRVLEVDRVDLDQGEVALAVLGAADRALHRVAGAQAEAADLGRRDVDVVRTRQVVRVVRAQEAEPVLKHLDRTGADDLGLVGRELLQDREHQLLLAHGRGILDLDLLREGDEFGRRFGLEVLELHLASGGEIGRRDGGFGRSFDGGESVVL
jgi:hypothetical protein